MGIILKKKESNKSRYYKLVKSTIKNIYDKNRYNPFNQAYSLHSNKFTSRRTSTKLFFDENNNSGITWKFYLLQKLEPSQNDFNWKIELYNFINKETFPNQYIFQNRIFF